MHGRLLAGSTDVLDSLRECAGPVHRHPDPCGTVHPQPRHGGRQRVPARPAGGSVRRRDVDQGPGRDGRGRPSPPGRGRDGPRLRGRGPHPPGQRLPEQLALHPRGRQHRGLPDVRLQPSPRASRRRAGAAQVPVPGPDHRGLLRPRARRHLPRGHRCDGARPRLAGRVHGTQLPGRHPRPRAVLHGLRLRADGLRRGRLRGRAGLPHQRHRLHRHRRRVDRPGDDPGRTAPRARSASGSRSTGGWSSS